MFVTVCLQSNFLQFDDFFKLKKLKKLNFFTEFLLLLEKRDRDSVKHVVLDCSAQLAKDIIVQHVRSVHLGRRNYHYLMSGLVLDDYWDKNVVEYGAINMTGLRLVNTDSYYARDFLKRWRTLDRTKYQAASNQVSLKGFFKGFFKIIIKGIF